MKITYYIRIGDQEPVLLPDPQARPDLLRALNEQAMKKLGYVPVKEKKSGKAM